jgi:type II secretory pathway component GspD/PulD (secretin)
MRGLILFLSGAVVALLCVGLGSRAIDRLSGSRKHTFSSFDPPRGAAAVKRFDTGMLKLVDADLDQVLNLYQEVSARTVIRSSHLAPVKISLHNQTPLSRVETLQLLDTTLAEYGITMVLAGDATVKAVPSSEAPSEIAPTIDPLTDEVPDSSSYMTCTIRLKNANGRDAIDVLAPVSRLPRSIVYMPAENLLILRDYSANIRQMLRVIQRLDNQPLGRLGNLWPATNTSGH